MEQLAGKFTVTNRWETPESQDNTGIRKGTPGWH
jgi:hypothetical protein